MTVYESALAVTELAVTAFTVIVTVAAEDVNVPSLAV